MQKWKQRWEKSMFLKGKKKKESLKNNKNQRKRQIQNMKYGHKMKLKNFLFL